MAAAVAGAESRHSRVERQEGGHMRTFIARFAKEEDGLSTAEYAVGTVAVAGLGGVLIKLLTSTEVRDLIWTVLSNAFSSMFG